MKFGGGRLETPTLDRKLSRFALSASIVRRRLSSCASISKASALSLSEILCLRELARGIN